jgi:hypothetical protein
MPAAMPALPIGAFEATPTSGRPAGRVRPQAARAPSACPLIRIPAAGNAAGPAPSLVAGDAGLVLQLTTEDPAGSLATLSRGLAAYQARLAGRVRYFGPATPVDLRV